MEADLREMSDTEGKSWSFAVAFASLLLAGISFDAKMYGVCVALAVVFLFFVFILWCAR